MSKYYNPNRTKNLYDKISKVGKKKAIKNVQPNTQIIIYETDGKARVEVRFEDENVWLTQKLMAELFEVAVSTINEHLKNIFSTGELSKKTVIRNFRITAADRKSYLAKHCTKNLSLILTKWRRNC